MQYIKYTAITLFFTLLLAAGTQAQKAEPELLKEPAAWTFERFNLPPAFAPGFPFTGAEELRFSPGMFKKDAPDYFTYAFAAQLDNRSSMSKDDIRNYLLAYFKGLCSSTAKDRKLLVDTSGITVAVQKKTDSPGNGIIYDALLHVFGVFADGAAVALNMEVKVLTDAAARKVYLVFIASPRAKTGEAWTQLYNIQKNFVIPVQKKSS